MILRDLGIDVHQQAVKSGWYFDRVDDPETRLGMLALIHSELSEALEAIRENQWEDYRLDSNPNKPLGLPSEMGDVVIRGLDFCVFFNMKIVEPLRRPLSNERMSAKQAGAWIGSMHVFVTDEDLNGLIQQAYDFSARARFDLDNAIREKHQFNSTRSFRHGNKAL